MRPAPAGRPSSMQANPPYVMDSLYPSYFYHDTQPLWLATIARLRGIEPGLDGALRYGELGCGTGFNAILVAALNPAAQVVGVDLNPGHIAIARDLARDMGVTNVSFHCLDFQAFLQQDTPPFDVMNCHGVWSWVAPRVQRDILEIVARRLKPKGLFCLHYMCHPGSTPMIPVHRLFRDLSRQGNGKGEGGSRAAVAAGLDAVERLLAAGYFDDQPRLRERLRGLRQAPPEALAHEMLAEFSSVHHAGDVHWLAAQAGLSFVGSSDPFYNTDPAICIPREMQPLLGQDASPAFVESLKDMASRRPHRSDVFQKQAALPDAAQRQAARDALVFVRNPHVAIPAAPTLATPLGPMGVSDDTFLRILELVRAKETVAFNELVKPGAAPGAALGAIQAFCLMLHAGLILPLQEEALLASEASVAAIDALFAARRVGLRLDRRSATARFVGL